MFGGMDMVKLKKYLESASPISKDRKKFIIEELEKVNKRIIELQKEFSETPVGSRSSIIDELFKEQARYAGMTAILSILGYSIYEDWVDETKGGR